MTGASPRHNIIHSNVFISAGIQLHNKKCQPLGSDMRLHIPENTFFTYPDIAIYCGDLSTIEFNEDTVIHPTIIIEILSPSTKSYDLGKKFEFYQAIPALKEYILIDSENIAVKSWRINAQKYWEPEEYKTLQETVFIPTVDVSIPMQDIYKRTSLAKQAGLGYQPCAFSSCFNFISGNKAITIIKIADNSITHMPTFLSGQIPR